MNVELVFKKIHRSLKQNGRIGFTIPLSISDALEESLVLLLRDPQWASYFDGFKLNYYLRDENYYDQLLLKNRFTKIHFEVVEQEWIFPSREGFEHYTLNWLPHLNALPEHLRERFFNQLMNKYVELNPASENGTLSFVFDRIDLIARKSFVQDRS